MERPANRQARTRSEPKPSPIPSIDGRLSQILGDRSSLTSYQRVEWIRAHSGELNDEEKATILGFIQSGSVPAGLGEREWHWIVDSLFTELRNGARDPFALTQAFYDIFSDRSLDAIVRDYVLQHLGHLGHQGGDAEIIHAAALAGVAEIETTIAGTALLLLHREPPPKETATLAAADPASLAMALINNPDASTAAKVTALQIAAQRGAEGVLDAAAALLQTDAPVMVKVAAVAAVAETGSNANLAILHEINADHPFLARAVGAGMQKLAAKD